MAAAGWGALYPTVGGLFEAGDGTFSAESPAWPVRIREVAHWPIRIALLAAAIFLSTAVFARVRRMPLGDLRRMAWLCGAIAAASALAFVVPIPWEAGRAAIHALLSLGIVYGLLLLLLRRTPADAGWLLGGVALGLLVLRYGAQIVIWSFPF